MGNAQRLVNSCSPKNIESSPPPDIKFVPVDSLSCQVSGRHVWTADKSLLRFDWPATKVHFQTYGAKCVWLVIDGGKSHFNLTVSSNGKELSSRVLSLGKGMTQVIVHCDRIRG